jgi:glucan phosphoethanolaminetransferase (alkaline phosphatase superfamily)
MALTAALVGIVIAMPAVTFSMGGADFKLMSYGIAGGVGGAGGAGGSMLVLEGAEAAGGVMTSTLSICTVAVLALAALVPFVTIFLFRRRQLQARLLGAEFALILGAAGLMVWYVLSSWKSVVATMADNHVLSIFPALLVVALVTNFAALKGVLRDELLVRSADRIR